MNASYLLAVFLLALHHVAMGIKCYYNLLNTGLY